MQALPTLIQMLRSDDVGIHYEAVGVIGNLVHSSQHIKKTVLDVRARTCALLKLSDTRISYYRWQCFRCSVSVRLHAYMYDIDMNTAWVDAALHRL